MEALRDGGKNLVYAIVPLAGVSLPGNRQVTLEARAFRHATIEFANPFLVAIEEVHEARLGSGRSLHPAERQDVNQEIQLFEIYQKVLNPQTRALSDRRQLGRLKMRRSELRHVLVFQGELRQLVDDAHQATAYVYHPLLHLDEIGIVSDKCAGRSQVNDSLRLRALDTVGIDMAHHVVTAALFFGFRDIEIDVLRVGLEFVYLLLRNRKAKLHFAFGEDNPELAPGFELVLRAEEKLHFPGSVSCIERVFVFVTHFRFPSGLKF